jgi:hypothetical protein
MLVSMEYGMSKWLAPEIRAKQDAWLAKRSVGLETDEISKEKIGRDPRDMSQDDLRALGHKPIAVLDAIRARCIDCCAGQVAEVRKCVAVECPSWPFRMAWNPWRERRELSDEQRKAVGERLAKARSSRGGDHEDQ